MVYWADSLLQGIETVGGSSFNLVSIQDTTVKLGNLALDDLEMSVD
jgi:hypothetical protein